MALTYEESAALTKDPSFKDKVKIACVKFADSIVIEAGNVPAHTSRLRWAGQCNDQPDFIGGKVQQVVVVDTKVQDAGVDAEGHSLITDDNLQSAVQAVVEKDFI